MTTKGLKTSKKKSAPTPAKKKSKITAVKPVAMARVRQEEFITRLSEKLTHFDARMVLEAAMLSAGVAPREGAFKKEEAKNICLALIKRGGPAFAVGTLIYRQYVGVS